MEDDYILSTNYVFSSKIYAIFSRWLYCNIRVDYFTVTIKRQIWKNCSL
jgi:hypothetical protein